jgi:hypothetical protein
VRPFAKVDSDYTSETYLDFFHFEYLFSVVTRRRSLRSHWNRPIRVYSEASSAEEFCILSKLAS